MVGEPVEERARGGAEPRDRTRVDRIPGDLGHANGTVWQRATCHVHNAPLR